MKSGILLMYICNPAILPFSVRICGFASLPYDNFAFLVIQIYHLKRTVSIYFIIATASAYKTIHWTK